MYGLNNTVHQQGWMMIDECRWMDVCGWMLVDGRLWMDICGWMLVDGRLWMDVSGWKGRKDWNRMDRRRRMSNGCRTNLEQTSDKAQMDFKWKSITTLDKCWTNVDCDDATTRALDTSSHKHLNVCVNTPSFVVLLFCSSYCSDPNTQPLFSCLESITPRLAIL